MTTNNAPWLDSEWIEHTARLLDSWEHWLDQPLITRSSPEQDAESLFQAPFVVVAHGTEVDPLLNYGNQAALELWDMTLDKFLGTPSRHTAEPVHRSERAELLMRTQRDGYIDDYSGIRISSTGKRFRIHQAVVWNMLDTSGQRIGQAATFSEWTMLDD